MNQSAPISLSALLLLLIIASACTSDDPPVEVTIMAAEIEGILIEEDGCLRITGASGTGGDAIVWQKDVLRIERQGDEVLIFKSRRPDAPPTPTAIWRLGDTVRGGGGMTRAEIADDHVGAGFSDRCEEPYFLMGVAN